MTRPFRLVATLAVVLTLALGVAVRFVRANAGKFQVNPNQLGITSGSSGGHLSLMAAYSVAARSPWPRSRTKSARGSSPATEAARPCHVCSGSAIASARWAARASNQ